MKAKVPLLKLKDPEGVPPGGHPTRMETLCSLMVTVDDPLVGSLEEHEAMQMSDDSHKQANISSSSSLQEY